MVTVINAHERMGAKGTYVSLELQGDLIMLQSQNTGRFYATAQRCFTFCTFNIETAVKMIGTKIEGSIVRVECDPYDFTLPETGEAITIAHSYSYLPTERTKKQGIMTDQTN